LERFSGIFVRIECLEGFGVKKKDQNVIWTKSRGLDAKLCGFSRALNYFYMKNLVNHVYGSWTAGLAGPPWTTDSHTVAASLELG
jgi:hypothetical protein